MKKKYLALAAALLLISTSQAMAGPENVGVGIKAGTLGGGVDLTKRLTDDLILRAGVNYLNFGIEATIGDIDYDMDANYRNANVLLDYHPFSGAFRLSGGLFLNANEVEVDGVVRQDRIPAEYAHLSPLADLVHVKGSVEFNSLAPYVGLGWKSNHGESGWGVACEFGVLFQGTPTVSDLYVQAPIDVNGVPIVQEFLAEEREEIQKELDGYEYYPVASIMLMYNF